MMVILKILGNLGKKYLERNLMEVSELNEIITDIMRKIYKLL